jgi:hypothetical protein
MEGQKLWDKENEDVSGYWVALMKRENTWKGGKMKHWTALYGKLTFEEDMDLS